MPMFTASCGRTRMTAGPPAPCGFVLSVPAPTIRGGLTRGRDERNQGRGFTSALERRRVLADAPPAAPPSARQASRRLDRPPFCAEVLTTFRRKIGGLDRSGFAAGRE